MNAGSINASSEEFQKKQPSISIIETHWHNILNGRIKGPWVH
jgi:hypothetical protein